MVLEPSVTALALAKHRLLGDQLNRPEARVLHCERFRVNRINRAVALTNTS